MIFWCSAPRWHLLSWVIVWNELEQTCIRLLKDDISPYISGFSLFMIFFGSAPRWHLLSWVIAWNELERTCIRLLKDDISPYSS